MEAAHAEQQAMKQRIAELEALFKAKASEAAPQPVTPVSPETSQLQAMLVKMNDTYEKMLQLQANKTDMGKPANKDKTKNPPNNESESNESESDEEEEESITTPDGKIVP